MTLGFKLHLPNIHPKNAKKHVSRVRICGVFFSNYHRRKDGQQIIVITSFHKGNPFEEK